MTEPLPSFDFSVITCQTTLDCAAEAAWRRLHSFADAGEFLDIDSALVSGDGTPGSVRRVGDKVLEVMTAIGPLSYAYAQIEGPMAALSYHGHLHVEPTGEGTSLLRYTLIYNQAPFDPAKRASEKNRIQSRFDGAVRKMKLAITE